MPKDKIIFAGIGAFLSASVQDYLITCLGFTIFTSTAAAAFAIGIYSEITARMKKTPATVILLPSTIPLLPGGSLYYAMSFLMNSEYNKFIKYAVETINTGFGIAVGTILTSILIQIIYYLKGKRKDLLK